MSIDPVVNFGKVTVSGLYNASQYQVTVSNASRLPDPAVKGPYNIVWYNDSNYPDPADDPNVEINRVISVSGNVLTLANVAGARTAQEGSSATTKNLNGVVYKIILAMTAKMITDLQNTDNLTEGATNLFLTTARVRAAISAVAPISYNPTSGAYSIAKADASTNGYISYQDWTTFNNKEPAITASTSSKYYRGDKTFQTLDTSVVTENGNLYYTSARANSDFDTRLATKTTTNLAEGTNLYYTDVRADARITAQKAQANGLATLDSGGLIPTSQLPALAITDTFVVASQAAMLALTAQVGDVAIRTDISETFILQTSPASTLANWKQILTPAAPVQSVNGKTGNVTLTTTDVAEGTNLYYTDARFDTRFASKTTDDLTEGSTNLYFTGARAITALTGQNISIFSNDSGYLVASALTSYAKLDGSNQSFTGAIGVRSSGSLRGDFDINKSTTTTIGDPTGSSSIYFNYYSGGYYAYGYSYEFKVYAFKVVGGVTIYSSTPLDVTGSDDSSNNNYTLQFSWSPVAGADGYKIEVVSDPYYGAYDNYSFTTTNTSVDISSGYDNLSGNSYGYESPIVVTPNSVSSGSDFYIDSTTGIVYNGNAYANVKGTGDATFDSYLHGGLGVSTDNAGANPKWTMKSGTGYLTTGLQFTNNSNDGGISCDESGVVSFFGNQVFFNLADRSYPHDLSKSGGFYQVNGVFNFWNNVAGQNTVSVGINGDMVVARNGYGTYSATGSSSTMPAKFTVINNVTTKIAEIIRAVGSQTASMTEWQDSGGSMKMKIDSAFRFFPVQATTVGAPAYVNGALYFDTTLNKLRVGGATAWETITSV